ncbi:MAG: hypothetical protein GY765_10500 [bacterium]|nr:hypothetical protein [bacterium]
MKKAIMIIVFISMVFSFYPLFGTVGTSDAFKDFFEPYVIAVDGNNLYASQRGDVFIISLKDLKTVAKFGKVGDGPREFRPLGNMGTLLYPQKEDVLIVNATGKMLYYTKKGKFIKEVPIRGIVSQLPMFQPLPGDRYAGAIMTLDPKIGGVAMVSAILDKDFKTLKKMGSTAFIVKQKMTFPMSSPRVAVSLQDNKIVYPVATGFALTISDDEGKITARIKRDEKPLKVTSAYKKDMVTFLKRASGPDFAQLKSMLQFADVYPAIWDFSVSKGKIYILTYRQEAGKSEFFVYTTAGKFVKRYLMPFALLDGARPAAWVAYDNVLYQVVETEDEVFQLHTHQFK